MVREGKLAERRVHINLVKLKKAGEHFEIVVDPDLAILFHNTGNGDIREILKAEKIFADASQGIFSSHEALQKAFGTIDPLQVAPLILKEGEIQLTATHRDKLREEKKNLVMSIIHRNAIDPKTNLPHPLKRIELAFDEAKITMNELKTAEEQVQDVLKKIMRIIPIRFSVKDIQAYIPANYAHHVFGVLKTFGTVQKADWASDGSLSCIVEVPGGMEEEFYDKMNSLTHGHIHCQVLRVK